MRNRPAFHPRRNGTNCRVPQCMGFVPPHRGLGVARPGQHGDQRDLTWLPASCGRFWTAQASRSVGVDKGRARRCPAGAVPLLSRRAPFLHRRQMRRCAFADRSVGVSDAWLPPAMAARRAGLVRRSARSRMSRSDQSDESPHRDRFVAGRQAASDRTGRAARLACCIPDGNRFANCGNCPFRSANERPPVSPERRGPKVLPRQRRDAEDDLRSGSLSNCLRPVVSHAQMTVCRHRRQKPVPT